MDGLIDIIERQSSEIGDLKKENESLKDELVNKLNNSEKKLNKKDISNKETLIMLFEDLESLKLRIQTLENKLGVTPILSSKKSPFDIDEDALAAMESNLPESEEL